MPISLQNVSVNAPDEPGRPLLRSIGLTLQERGVTLLIGHTGSGKSTLLQVLAGVREPSAGTIMLDGRPLWQKGRAAREHLLRFGLTFQFAEQQLFARSIRQEFAYSLRPYRLEPDERERRVRSVSGEFDPGGVWQPERSPFSLSGGEQRRLALATTFAALPDWLFMDEPTAGLEAAAARELLSFIRERKRQGGGTVIVTHDLDTFFPLADRVVLLERGAIAADGPPERFCTDPAQLIQAGVGIPGSAALAQALRCRGLELPADCMTPERAAAAVERLLADRRGQARPDGPAAKPPGAPESGASAAGAALRQPPGAAGEPPAAHSGLEPAEAVQPFWYRLDPRAKWLLYLMMVIGAMLQQRWTGLAFAALPVAAGFAGLPRSVLRGGWKIAKPFVWFSLFSVVLAGLKWSGADANFPLGFSAEQAAVTGLNVSRLLLVTVAGYWLAAATPYTHMVQGLNWALRFGAKLKLPVESLALAVSLIFRFLPLILREWQRFSAIVRARGKAPLRPGAVRARDIPALVVPLLLSLFYRAEEMTMAMEMKKRNRRLPTGPADRLHWRRTDTFAAAAGVVCLALLVFLRE